MPARQSFAVEMVGRDDVANAVGLNSALFNASRILGPAAAGLLIGASDISIAFLINGISFIAVIVSYLAMRDSELRPCRQIARPTTGRRGHREPGRGRPLRPLDADRAAGGHRSSGSSRRSA